MGHTDAIGTEAYNQALSMRRVASNQTREGRAQSRRVEIEVVGTQKP